MAAIMHKTLTLAELDQLMHFALKLADAAAQVTMPHFRSGLSIDHKDGIHAFDPVTAADRNAETAMRDLIAAHFPGHGIYGEEHGHQEGVSDLTWVLDPIDGTRSFISGVPLWGTLIGLNDGTKPIIGVMDQPYIGERFIGRPGSAELLTRHGNRPLHTSACTKLKDALLGNTDPAMFRAPAEREAFNSLRSSVRLTRYSGDSYHYCLVAAGTIDLVVESSLQPYDIQALMPIIREAGGVVSDWAGGDPQWGGHVIAAATPELHAAALEILRPAIA